MHQKAKAAQIIALAKEHAHKANMRGSAELCISDAEECLVRDLPEYAIHRAVRSLAYSVGIASPLYKEARAFDTILTSRI
jgi:hypothetical protein